MRRSPSPPTADRRAPYDPYYERDHERDRDRDRNRDRPRWGESGGVRMPAARQQVQVWSFTQGSMRFLAVDSFARSAVVRPEYVASS